MKVVFTGAAQDRNGTNILRADLQAAAELSGHQVLSSPRSDMELLVASRSDTKKAREAQARGVPVMTYPAFIVACLSHPIVEGAGKRDPWVDGPAKTEAPAKQKMLDLGLDPGTSTQ